MIRHYLTIGLLLLWIGPGQLAAQKHPLTVPEAVSTRRLASHGVQGEVAIAPDGSRVAYILEAPDVAKDSNNDELYVRRLGYRGRPSNGRRLAHADRLAHVHWLADSRGLLVIETAGKYPAAADRLLLIDARSGKRQEIPTPATRIRSFSADASGERLVICAAVPRTISPAERARQNRYGFRIAPGEPVTDSALIENWLPDSVLYLGKRNAGGTWRFRRLPPRRFAGGAVRRWRGEVTDLALSPNGRFLLFKYTVDSVPASWQGFYAAQLRLSAFPVPLWGLLDLHTDRLQPAFDAPALSYTPPVWSHDSQSFALSALPPQHSAWEQSDLQAGLSDLPWQWDSFLHLFVVQRKTGAISQALARFQGSAGSHIAWGRNDESLSVTLNMGELIRLQRTSGGWKQILRSRIFKDGDAIRLQDVSCDGSLAVGLREDVAIPPNLVVRDLNHGDNRVLTDWNPAYRAFALGTIEKIRWVNRYGVNCWGYLIQPVGYVPGKKYPLVVMNKPREEFFVADGSYTTAFPPQTLAGDGFAVLMTQYFFNVNELPGGFPGKLAEAYNWMAMIESGIETLVERGLVDPRKVGIIGFSRTSWKTDFLLTHSDFPFAAASSADGGLYNYGNYWFLNYRGVMRDAENMMGGPPYGKTFANWLKYAPAFNAERVRCPVLMEYTGHGHLPYGPIAAFEFFTALYRQHKPVELYFYPLGDHPLATPSERVASLQRNVDWFRFWIQGYQGVAPAYDPDQFARWRELRQSPRNQVPEPLPPFSRQQK